MEIASEIIADKELRRDTDAIIQRAKGLPPTRERSLAITKLQEGVMWLGMDLKRIHDSTGAAETKATTDDRAAKEAYHRYAEVTAWKNFRGDPMPQFDELPPTIQAAWRAAASVPLTPGNNPYPNSKDPSNTIIEPTADGLKL